MTIPRRTFLTGSAALVVASLAAARARAQGDVIRLGTLTPLTGAGQGSRTEAPANGLAWADLS